MEYWLYTDDYPGDYPRGIIPNNEWAICTFEYGDEDEDVETAVVKEVIAIGTNDFVAPGFEMELFDDAITDDPKRVLKFLFDRKFY